MALVFNMVGGATGKSAAIKKDVNFYDYDGTLIAGYTISEARALSALPEAPSHSGDAVPLTFQEWNYTLAEVVATNSRLDVGAIYITSDAKTHILIRCTEVSGYSFTLYFYKSDTSIMTINWGDGNSSTLGASGGCNISHTYTLYGDFNISTWISSGSGNYRLGGGSSSDSLLGSTDTKCQALLRVFIGGNVIYTSAYAFSSHASLISVTLPNSVLNIQSHEFDSCYSLTALIVPRSIAFGGNEFTNCYSLSVVSLSGNITQIRASGFTQCMSLARMVIPPTVQTVENYAFQYCFSMKEIVLSRAVPPILSGAGALSGITSACRIKVPASYLAAYRAAENWSTYANYMEGY